MSIKEPLLTPKKTRNASNNTRQSPFKDKEIRKVEDLTNENKETASDLFPDTIRSSVLLHESNRDFSVIIKLPCIEYSILSKNFTFLKYLTRLELTEYLE